MRTTVDLPKQQLQALTDVSRREQISRAEAIRRAVADYLKKHDSAASSGHSGFGLWKGRTFNALSYEYQLRGDWHR